MTSPRLRVAVGGSVLLLVAVALAGCSAEAPPEPEESTPISQEPIPQPTTPEEVLPIPLDELALGPEGLGSLLLGRAAVDDAELGMVHLDPRACTDEETGFDAGIQEGDLLASLWVANDVYRDSGGASYFGVNVEPGGTVTRIDLFTHLIPTDEGIRIGDPAADALAAYPDARVFTGDLSDLLVVSGDSGILQIEIARETGLFDTAYWNPGEADTVRYINASLGNQHFNVVASDNVAGVCPF